MENTNPNGSENQSQGTTVQDAANSFLGLMDVAEAPEEGQVEAAAEQPEEELVSEDEQQEWQDESEQEELEPESDDQEEEVEQTYSVKVAGEDKELTLSELKSLAQQGADYTKKTQQVAEQRKALEAEAKAIEEAKYLRDAYAQRLQAMEQLLNAPEQNEDLEYLKESDPIGYAVRVAEKQQQREQLQAVQAERQRIAEQQQAEYAQQMQGYLAQQAEQLSKVLPDYTDPVKGEALRSELRTFAKSNLGFTDEELSQVRDSRHVVALHKAMLYDKLQKARPEVNKRANEAPKTIKSGNGVKPTTSENVKRQQQQLRQSGKVRDAAKLFENFI
jgi:hypothetical protein